MLITRADAKAQGLKHYYTGKPCKRGHIEPRFTSEGSCVACAVARAKNWNTQNPQKQQACRDAWNEANPERVKAIHSRWHRDNREKSRAASYAWRGRNPHKVRASQYRRRKARYYTDPVYRLGRFLRVRLSSALNGRLKVGSFVQDLGCTPLELRAYLEARWESGMTWDNYSTDWQIDHTQALGLFDLTDRTQFLQAAHYTNLQPMWRSVHTEKSKQDCLAIQAKKIASLPVLCQT